MNIRLLIFLLLIFSGKLLSASNVDTMGRNTIILNKNKEYNSLQIFKGDTLEHLDSASLNDMQPTSESYREKFTPEQDTAYQRAKRIQLPLSTRLWKDLIFSDRNWELFVQKRESQPINRIYEQLANIPQSYLKPDPKEQMQRDIMIQNSQYVPFVNTMPMYGAKIPFSAIGGLLGLTEDVSPNINYRLDKYTNIEVVIYSIRASVVAVLFKGNQPAGNHSLKWNGRDDNGKALPPGDYIAEVRIGSERFIRKRIQIN